MGPLGTQNSEGRAKEKGGVLDDLDDHLCTVVLTPVFIDTLNYSFVILCGGERMEGSKKEELKNNQGPAESLSTPPTNL
jgi:hypothetical protein